jgi:predicted butyrate kinase (DUF1464 family)
MLSETKFNPSVRITSRVAKMQQPANRAAYLGNDITGKTHGEVVQDVRLRATPTRAIWNTTAALMSYVGNKYNAQ